MDRVIGVTDAEVLLARIAGLERDVAELQQQVAQLAAVEPNSAEDWFVFDCATT
jgi:hypothetical protein